MLDLNEVFAKFEDEFLKFKKIKKPLIFDTEKERDIKLAEVRKR